MLVKKFHEFILEEFTRIISHSSSSRKTKQVDTIFDYPTTNKSRSSSILLKKKLADAEIAELSKELNIDKDLLRRFGSDKERGLIAINNHRFLKKSQLKNNNLYCEYCGHGPLIIYPFGQYKKSDGATVDHKNPISKGGSKFDFNNLAVCCDRCNKAKKDLPFEEWIRIKDQWL